MLPDAGALRFAKLHADGQSYIVVNALDAPSHEWKALAVAICAAERGVAGTQLAVITHRGRAEFDLLCFSADGSPALPAEPVVACAALTIRRRYGYRQLRLRDAVDNYLVEVLDTNRVSVRQQAAPNERVSIRRVDYLFDGQIE